MSDTCPKCKGPIACLAGESAHPSNWYCVDEKGCGWQAWSRAPVMNDREAMQAALDMANYMRDEGMDADSLNELCLILETALSKPDEIETYKALVLDYVRYSDLVKSTAGVYEQGDWVSSLEKTKAEMRAAVFSDVSH